MLQCIYLFPRATKLLQRRHKAHEIFETRRVFALIGKAKRDVCALDVFKYHLLADRKKKLDEAKSAICGTGRIRGTKTAIEYFYLVRESLLF